MKVLKSLVPRNTQDWHALIGIVSVIGAIGYFVVRDRLKRDFVTVVDFEKFAVENRADHKEFRETINKLQMGQARMMGWLKIPDDPQPETNSVKGDKP